MVISRTYIIIFVVLALSFVVTVSDDSFEGQDETTHKYHRGPTHRKRTPVCINGKPIEGACECDLDYVGKHCEKKKNCATFKRYRNGSCPVCLKGYTGEFCENINCEHGTLNLMETECECEKPFSGQFCSELDQGAVYSYYNNKVFLLGPLGALSLIPMCLLYFGCEKMAQKRQTKRVGLMLDGQNINIKDNVLHQLLTAEEV